MNPTFFRLGPGLGVVVHSCGGGSSGSGWRPTSSGIFSQHSTEGQSVSESGSEAENEAGSERLGMRLEI